MTELFSNLGQTTINQVGGIGATDTTVVVSALNGTNPGNTFPSSGNFRVLFGTDVSSEIALCTAVNTTTKTLTIARGQEGTNPKAWPNGTSVTISVTSQSLNQMRADLWSIGSYANRPTQGLPTGSYYQTVDGHTPWVWDPGVGAWRPQINGVLGFQPPPAATFSIGVNQGTSTIVDSTKGALDFTNVADSANTVNFHGWFFPFSGPCIVEACIIHQVSEGFVTNTWTALGPAFRESSSGKLCFQASAQQTLNGLTYGEFDIYSNPTTRTSSTSFNVGQDGMAPLFVRIARDNVNVYSYFSRDRVVWTNITTNTIASIFTTAPDQVGIGGFSAGFAGFAHVLSWSFMPLATVPDQVITPNIHILRSQIFMPPPNPPAPTQPTGWIGPVFHQ